MMMIIVMNKWSVNRALIDIKSVAYIRVATDPETSAVHTAWASAENQQWFLWFMLQAKRDHE